MKLLVLSIDALFSEDMDYLAKRPKLAPFFRHALTALDMRACYPALTYPCHVSILSGNSPARHGIYHNLECIPGVKYQDWKWYYKDIQCPTLWDSFRQAGWTSASVFWPVSALAPVDYLVPEIWSYDKDPVDVIAATSGGKAEHIIRRHQADVDFTSKFKLDRFAAKCAMDIVEEFDPDVMFWHLSLVDSTRHKFGAKSPKVMEALEQCALWLEEMLDKIRARISLEELSLVILGDHGHLDCRGSISPNSRFAENGWLTLPVVTDAKKCPIYCHGAGVSAQVYVNDLGLSSDAEALFEHWKSEGYLLEWFTKEQAREYGLDGPFDYVLEAGEGYFFADQPEREFFVCSQAKDGGSFIGKHGHWPLRGEKPPFFLSDKRIQNCEFRDRTILDIAPTVCDLFDLPHGEMEGHSLLQKKK